MIVLLIFFFLIFLGGTMILFSLAIGGGSTAISPVVVLLLMFFLALTILFGVLTYRRIFKRKVNPNKFKGVRVEHPVVRVVLYVMFLLAVLGVYVMYIEDIALVILIFAFFYPACIFAILFYTRKKITVTLSAKSNYEMKKNPLPLIITINNPTFFPISRAVIKLKYTNIFSDFTTYETFEIPIKAKTAQQLLCNAVSHHCGEFTVTLCEFRLFDYMRNFSLRKKTDFAVKTKIMPLIYDLNCLIESTDIQNDSDKLSEYYKGDDPSQIFDLRDYVEGDKLNKIHWKLTVKLDKPIVKEYSQSISAGYALIFNFNTETDMGIIDTLLETVYSLAFFLISNDKSLKICYFNESYKEVFISDDNDLLKLNDIFITRFSGEEVLGDFAEKNSATLFSHIIYVSENIGETTFAVLDSIENAYKKSALAIKSNIDHPNIHIINPEIISSSLENLIL